MRTRTALAAAVAALAGAGAVALAVSDEDASPPATAAVDGATLFRLKGCAQCHDGPDSTAVAAVGPPLVGAATWAGTRRPGLDAEAYVRESIRTPDAFAAASSPFEMPTLALTDEEVDRLVDYVLGR